jgi:hypothetical protein
MLYLTSVFETVLSFPVGDNIQQQWHRILKFPCKCCLDVDLDQCHFPIFDNVTNNCSTNLPLSLELPLQSLPYDHHTDLPFFPPAGNATDAPARAPEGDQEGASVGNSAGIQTSAQEGVSAANNIDVMTGDDNVVPPR